MKKFKYNLLILSILVCSCKENPKTELKEYDTKTISYPVENEQDKVLSNPLQITKSEKDLYKALKKKTPLTDDQLLAILPEHINGNKKLGEHAFDASNQFASGMYGSANSPYNFWIEDGSGSRAIVRNFFDSYKLKNQEPEGTQYIFTELKGYKTIAFLQPKIYRNQISFIYNNRFRISLERPDNVEELWSYIDFENLKKLDQFN